MSEQDACMNEWLDKLVCKWQISRVYWPAVTKGEGMQVAQVVIQFRGLASHIQPKQTRQQAIFKTVRIARPSNSRRPNHLGAMRLGKPCKRMQLEL